VKKPEADPKAATLSHSENMKKREKKRDGRSASQPVLQDDHRKVKRKKSSGKSSLAGRKSRSVIDGNPVRKSRAKSAVVRVDKRKKRFSDIL